MLRRGGVGLDLSFPDQAIMMLFTPPSKALKMPAAQRRKAQLAILFIAIVLLGQLALAQPVCPETIAAGMQGPWSLAFLPDGHFWATGRSGHFQVVAPDGRLAPGSMASNSSRFDHFLRISCGFSFSGVVDEALHKLAAIVAQNIPACDGRPGRQQQAEQA